MPVHYAKSFMWKVNIKAIKVKNCQQKMVLSCSQLRGEGYQSEREFDRKAGVLNLFNGKGA